MDLSFFFLSLVVCIMNFFCNFFDCPASCSPVQWKKTVRLAVCSNNIWNNFQVAVTSLFRFDAVFCRLVCIIVLVRSRIVMFGITVHQHNYSCSFTSRRLNHNYNYYLLFGLDLDCSPFHRMIIFLLNSKQKKNHSAIDVIYQHAKKTQPIMNLYVHQKVFLAAIYFHKWSCLSRMPQRMMSEQVPST